MNNRFRQTVLGNPSLLVVALQNVFVRYNLAFACLFYSAPPRRLAHRRTVLSSALTDEINERCEQLVQTGKHPALRSNPHFLSPLDMLDPKLDFGDDPDVLALMSLVYAENFKTYFCVPLRDSAGALIIAGVASRDRSHTRDEMKIIQADCYDALAVLEAEFEGDLKIAPVLSDRERECLICAARGLTERETAVELKISPHTVHAHIENAKRRLGAPNKLVTVIKSIKSGEIADEEIIFD